MGNLEKTTTQIPFWYKRMSEVTWLLTLVVVSLWVIGSFLPQQDLAIVQLATPLALVIGSCAASLLMIIAYARPTHASSHELIKYGYALIFSASLYTVISTGNINSPFIALWLLVSIFPAIFGLSVFIPAVISTNLYLAYLYFSGLASVNELLISIVAFEVPLIVSFLIWRTGVKHDSRVASGGEPSIKALAKELSQVSSQSDIVINAIADGVLAVDGQGVVQLINPAAQRIIGWGKQDALRLDYRSVLQLFDNRNKDVSDSLDPIQKCLHTNETVETDQLLLATTSGKKLMVSLLVSPIGQIGNGAIVVFRDITAARAEERQQAEFISTASHEMRTPVAAIEGYIGLALNPATATIDDKAKIYLGKAHESAQHLGRLFQDLLDISKAEDGRLDNDPSVIDLVAYMRDITMSFNHMATTKGLILLYKPDVSTSTNQHLSPAYFVKADPDHVREVTANLIENAIKYTKTGDVTVDIVGDDEHAEVAITDTGIGIPQEDISHLFQKFYRIDSTDTREIGGTGLGLYLCRRLVEAMGGRIWVTSNYGKGSTFHVELPRMNNVDAVREIEAAVDQQTTAPEFHAKASFLASEEEAVAIQQAATPSQPVVQPAQDQPVTPASAPIATPIPAPASAPAPVAIPVPVPTAAPATTTAPPAPMKPTAPAPVKVQTPPAIPTPAMTSAPSPAPAATPIAATPEMPAIAPAADTPGVTISEDGTLTQTGAIAPRPAISATPRANAQATSEPNSSKVAF